MSAPERKYCSHCNAAFASQIDKCPRDGADLQRFDINPLLGQVFGGRYRLVEKLGAGGMGEVYRAEHVTIGKSFAIKVLLGEVAADNGMVARFHREAKALSLLSHRNIVSVADFGETDEGLLYLATEFINGTSLSYEMRQRKFDVDRIIHILRQIGKALAHAHRRGLVHRDLKPDNVMLVQADDERDVVKILDFGIARVVDNEATDDIDTINRLTTQGIVMGTPAYISPEQAMGTPVDHRADLYSLGVVLYELLAGDLPFSGKNPIELMSKHLREAPPELVREDITGEFRALTMRLLEKKPEDRFKDADTFLALLEALKETRPSGTYVPNFETAVDLDPMPMRQGSDTLLAPLEVLENGHSKLQPSDDALQEADEDSSTGRAKGLLLGALGLAAVAGVAILTLGGGHTTPNKPVAVAAIPDAGVAPAIADAASPPNSKNNSVDAASVNLVPIAPTNVGAAPTKIKATKKKPPPTLDALQSSVETIGKRMGTLKSKLDASQVDALRRKWLDLATALPSLSDTPEARRKFSSRLRNLRNAIKKASRSK